MAAAWRTADAAAETVASELGQGTKPPKFGEIPTDHAIPDRTGNGVETPVATPLRWSTDATDEAGGGQRVSSTPAVAVLAQGLRDLRDYAEGPDGEDLRERTGLSAQQIDTALGGEQLPSREVTLALVA